MSPRRRSVSAHDAGRERVIDFVTAVFGLHDSEIGLDAVSMAVLDALGQATGQRFRVMHPVASMGSRGHNVVGLAHTRHAPRPQATPRRRGFRRQCCGLAS